MNQPLHTQGAATTIEPSSGLIGSSPEHIAAPSKPQVIPATPVDSLTGFARSISDITLAHQVMTADNLLLILDLDRSLASNHAPNAPYSIPEIAPGSLKAVAQLIQMGAHVLIPTGRPTEAVQKNLFDYAPVRELLTPEEMECLREVTTYGGFGLSHAVGNETPVYENIELANLAAIQDILNMINVELDLDLRDPDWSRGIPLFSTDDHNVFCEVQVKGRRVNTPLKDFEYVPHVVTLYAGTTEIPKHTKEWALKQAEIFGVDCVVGSDAIEFVPRGFASTKIHSLDHYIKTKDIEGVSVIVVGDGHQDKDLMTYLCHGEFTKAKQVLSVCVADEDLFTTVPAPRVNVPDPVSADEYSPEWQQSVKDHDELRPWEVIEDYLRTVVSIRSADRETFQKTLPVVEFHPIE